jgi:hypothetical protein
MDYILGRIISYNIKYEKVTDNTIRVYGNFNGYSVVRFTENNIVVDGRLQTEDEFENWLFLIK